MLNDIFTEERKAGFNIINMYEIWHESRSAEGATAPLQTGGCYCTTKVNLTN